VARHRSRWRKSTAEPGAEVALRRLAVERLVALGLARCCEGGVEARPALARFAYGEATVS
jgi:hypothetical protein